MAHKYLFYSYKTCCFILRENLLTEEVLLKCWLTPLGLKGVITQKTTIQNCICVVCTLTSRHILFMLWRCIITLLNILYRNEERKAVTQTIFTFYFLTAVYISQWDVTNEDIVNILCWSLYIVLSILRTSSSSSV